MAALRGAKKPMIWAGAGVLFSGGSAARRAWTSPAFHTIAPCNRCARFAHSGPHRACRAHGDAGLHNDARQATAPRPLRDDTLISNLDSPISNIQPSSGPTPTLSRASRWTDFDAYPPQPLYANGRQVRDGRAAPAGARRGLRDDDVPGVQVAWGVGRAAGPGRLPHPQPLRPAGTPSLGSPRSQPQNPVVGCLGANSYIGANRHTCSPWSSSPFSVNSHREHTHSVSHLVSRPRKLSLHLLIRRRAPRSSSMREFQILPDTSYFEVVFVLCFLKKKYFSLSLIGYYNRLGGYNFAIFILVLQ